MSAPEPDPGWPEFAYRAGELAAEEVPLSRIAAQIGTPFYAYSSTQIERRYQGFAAAFADQQAAVYYSVKANSNLAVIATLARLGAGADVVSEGEFRRALAAGIPAERIIFSGVGKTAAELRFALAQGVHQINVESMPELAALSELAVAMGVVAPVAIRINPDVDARTHDKIATGRKENKFGIDLAHAIEAYRLAAKLPGIAPYGMAVHIGSQLTAIEPFRLAFARMVELFGTMRTEGIALNRLDLGGGIGIRYGAETPPAIADYAAAVKGLTGNLGAQLAFEPGRYIVGNAGLLVTRILYIKEGVTRRFVIVDAAMNDLVRHALYDAWHEIVPLKAPAPGADIVLADVVGPVCETGDAFAAQRPLPPLQADEMLALLSAGAYGASMSSSYNTRLLVPEVLVRGAAFAVIRRRPSYEEVLAQDRLPAWLGAQATE